MSIYKQTYNNPKRQYQTSFLNDQTAISNTERSFSRRAAQKSKKKIIPVSSINTSELICIGNSSIRIKEKIDELLFSMQRKDTKLYGMNIGNEGKGRQLKTWEKVYLCSCYWVLNLQPIFPKQLTETISRMKVNEDQIDEIRVQCGQIKFDKINHSLIYNRQNNSLRISPKTYNLDMLGYPTYERSIILMKVGGWSYRFDSTILQVESTEAMIAVRTQEFVYIIYKGNLQSYKLKCCNVKWGHNGLYLLKDGGEILIIETQKQYFNKKINFILRNESLGEWKDNDFLVGYQKQMILVSPSRNSINLKVLNGLQTIINIVDLEEDVIIYYINGYISKNQLIVFLVTGKNNVIQQINQFSFIMV